MALPLPDGKVQLFNASGEPLAGGYVYHYIPGTSTPKDTYQDINATILNANPVILDVAGRAVIFGTGSYRQVATDSLGNQQWDQVTQVATLALLGGVAKAGDTMTGTLIAPAVSVTGAQTLSIAPTANPITTLASLNVQGSTQSSTTREFQTAMGLTNSKGVGLTGGNQDRVTLYLGHDAVTGGGDGWSLNSVLTMNASAEATSNFQGYELDFNNLLAHRGEAAQGAGLAAPVAYGLTVTGASSFRSTSAIAVSGPGTPIWNRGIVFGNSSVAQATIQDLTSSTISVEILGTHNYGIDMRNGAFTTAALRLGNGAFIRARDGGDTADLAVLVQSGANLIMADAATTATYFRGTTAIAPFVDNAIVCGSNTNRWSAVWAVNGTIQTSDPREKTDIQTLAGVNTGAILDAIAPISFRWVDGGGGKPGARTHWGFDASTMEQVAEIAGRDWGGFVRAEDGALALRPDQIIPIMFEELRRLRERVAGLEGVV